MYQTPASWDRQHPQEVRARRVWGFSAIWNRCGLEDCAPFSASGGRRVCFTPSLHVPLNSSAQTPTKKKNKDLMVEGNSWNEPVSPGEVQKTDSGISDSWAGEGRVPKALPWPSRQRSQRPPCVVTRPAQWMTALPNRQACKDAEWEGRLDSPSQLRERQKIHAVSEQQWKRVLCVWGATLHPAQVRGTAPNTCLSPSLGDYGCCLREVRSEVLGHRVTSPFPNPGKERARTWRWGQGLTADLGAGRLVAGLPFCLFSVVSTSVWSIWRQKEKSKTLPGQHACCPTTGAAYRQQEQPWDCPLHEARVDSLCLGAI